MIRGTKQSMCGRPRLASGSSGFFELSFACIHVCGLLVRRAPLAKMVSAAGVPVRGSGLVGHWIARSVSRHGSNDQTICSSLARFGAASREALRASGLGLSDRRRLRRAGITFSARHQLPGDARILLASATAASFAGLRCNNARSQARLGVTKPRVRRRAGSARSPPWRRPPKDCAASRRRRALCGRAAPCRRSSDRGRRQPEPGGIIAPRAEGLRMSHQPQKRGDQRSDARYVGGSRRAVFVVFVPGFEPCSSVGDARFGARHIRPRADRQTARGQSSGTSSR